MVQLRFACMGHVIVPHALPSGLQLTSHLHELAHATAAHAPLPVQLTWHAVVPHVMSPHGWVSVHVIAQRHVAGHVIAAALPVMLHVPVGKSHEVHSGGHTAASITFASIGPSVTQ